MRWPRCRRRVFAEIHNLTKTCIVECGTSPGPLRSEKRHLPARVQFATEAFTVHTTPMSEKGRESTHRNRSFQDFGLECTMRERLDADVCVQTARHNLQLKHLLCTPAPNNHNQPQEPKPTSLLHVSTLSRKRNLTLGTAKRHCCEEIDPCIWAQMNRTK